VDWAAAGVAKAASLAARTAVPYPPTANISTFGSRSVASLRSSE
jgi:hypothetical protein